MKIELEVNLYGDNDKMFIEFEYWINGFLWKDQKNYRTIWGKRSGT